MTTGLFDYPRSAAFGRVLPKSKIYEHAGASAGLKQLFVSQVDQIVWRFKLAPETINLAATASVTEIQIFEISLRAGSLDEDVLRAIDCAIPFPLIFELTWSGKCRATAAFKRPSEADASKWVISEYFSTKWVGESGPRDPLPVALDLGGLYDKLLTAMMPAQVRSDGPIQERVDRLEAIRAQAREVDRIKSRLTREKQFNKRVEINAELRDAKMELERLSRADVPMAATSE
ncbi:MAG: DUF4391 domain-containing protein [Reyranella sp.]|nr:DUF4391 domain-containing protein [Reyranella sp.]